MRLPGYLIIASVLCLSACGPPADPSEAKPNATERMREVSEVRAVSLFPEASEVRMFVNRDVVSFDDAGEPSNGTYPEHGILLTEVEAATLRAAVRDVPPPDAIAACCVPRHAFVFYDASGARLGVLDVCFECICANIRDGARLDRPRDVRWLEWDEAAIAAIVTAHGERTTFEEL